MTVLETKVSPVDPPLSALEKTKLLPAEDSVEPLSWLMVVVPEVNPHK
jgi:hypothetical protein